MYFLDRNHQGHVAGRRIIKAVLQIKTSRLLIDCMNERGPDTNLSCGLNNTKERIFEESGSNPLASERTVDGQSSH